MNGHIGVEKEDNRAARFLSPRVPRGGGAERLRMMQHFRAEAFGERGRVVGRAIVDDDQFIVSVRRVAKPSEAALEVATSVVHGDHHRKRTPPRLRAARRTGGEIVHELPSPVYTPRAGMQPHPWDRPNLAFRPTSLDRFPRQGSMVCGQRSRSNVVGLDVRRDFRRNRPRCQPNSGHNRNQASAADKASPAARIVWSISESVWAAETNAASNWLQGK